MTYPTLEQAEQLLVEGERLNPGKWARHSRVVAQAAHLIGAQLPGIDPDRVYIAGLLHDIGRRAGESDMRHILDGYTYLVEQGFSDAARICLTHSFPVKDAHAGSGEWDGSEQEMAFVQDYLAKIEYTDEDRLIQLCDALALPSGFCLIEKRLLDVSLRHGFNGFTLAKWRAFLQIQQDFEKVIGTSIYDLLPGVVENTFKTHVL
jgi:hypothetical protein